MYLRKTCPGKPVAAQCLLFELYGWCLRTFYYELWPLYFSVVYWMCITPIQERSYRTRMLHYICCRSLHKATCLCVCTFPVQCGRVFGYTLGQTISHNIKSGLQCVYFITIVLHDAKRFTAINARYLIRTAQGSPFTSVYTCVLIVLPYPTIPR